MYNVIVLAEQAMSPGDATEVVSLHDAIEDERHYHVLIPCEDASARVETALGSLGATESLTGSGTATSPSGIDAAQHDLDHEAQDAVATSISALETLHHRATGQYSHDDPIETLDQIVAAEHADEVIVMTRPHVVQEFFHVDWTSKARRRLGVPVLHLIEHEPLEAEAGPPEGIIGV
ncbi:MAG: hypothetical protein ACR2LE_01035 [Nocardioidaceae bacterium]